MFLADTVAPFLLIRTCWFVRPAATVAVWVCSRLLVVRRRRGLCVDVSVAVAVTKLIVLDDMSLSSCLRFRRRVAGPSPLMCVDVEITSRSALGEFRDLVEVSQWRRGRVA